VQACPTATLTEKTVIKIGIAEHSATTTCAYCGVGCGFKAEMKGSEVVRMVPWTRQGEPWSFLRQGTFCVGLCDAQRSHHAPDDS